MEIPIIVMLLTFFASVLGTVSGFGVSTVMIPLLVVSYPLPQVLLFVAIIHLANDVWKLLLFHQGIRWHLLLYFGGAGLVATVVGSVLSVYLGEMPWFLRGFGLFLTLYALFLLARPKFKIKETMTALLAGGALEGFLFGLFGMGGLARSTVLISFNMEKYIFLATNAAIALVVDITRVIVYQIAGLMMGSELKFGLLFCIPLSFVGAKVGQRLVGMISQAQFRLMIAGFVFLMGVKLVLKF